MRHMIHTDVRRNLEKGSQSLAGSRRATPPLQFLGGLSCPDRATPGGAALT
jgi:hypothetical protein